MSNRLPGEEAVLADRILRRLEAAGREGIPASRLRRELAAEAGSEADLDLDLDLDRALARLRRAGSAVERQGRWLAVAGSPWEVGVVEGLEEGDALIRPPGSREAAYFVAARQLKGALDGDTVLIAPQRRRRRGGDGRRLPEATVEEVIDRRHQRLVGTVEVDEEGRRWLAPFDARLSLEVEVMGEDGARDGVFVVVALDAAAPPGGHPTGRVVEVLGDAAAPGVDVLVVLRHFDIPEHFPDEVTAAAAGLPADPRSEDWRGRESLRGHTVVTIDGADARDFDDAVSLERLTSGGWRLGVHIADVAHYVAEGGVLDREAYHRGTSVYYPERAVPMLPERLSNGLCSLRPGVPRLTLSVFLDLDGEGQVRRRRFAETVIESARRLTYDEVRRVLEEPRPVDPATYGEVLPLLSEMRALMEKLHRARLARGSIDFDLPEGDVVLDTDGQTVGIRPGQRHVAHRIIEELMIAANEAVAFELLRRGAPALYRVHDAPDPSDLEELRKVLRGFGIRLKGELDALPPSALQEVLARAEGRPEGPFLTALVLRSMRRAFYHPECRGHYALASRHYTHFTSPIRRYPDLVVHRQLKALVRGEPTEGAGLAERLPEIARHASSTERRAESSERELLQWKKVRFLADRVGERFRGTITGVQPFGLFVQLEGLYVDGLVPIRLLEDDYYVYEAETHRLVGANHGRVFRLADEVEVDLVGVDLRHRGLDLKIPGMVRRDKPKGRSGDRQRKAPRRRR